MNRKIATAVAATLVASVLIVGIESAGAAKRPPGPLRVLLVGDSLTNSYQDEAAAALAAKGYEVARHGSPGSGLLDAHLCHGQYAKLAVTGNPDVVVMGYVGNYSQPPCSTKVKWGTPGFYKQWTRSARLSQRVLSRRGARFLWLLLPSATRAGYATVLPQVQAIHRSLGPVIDGYGAGVYDPSIHVADGLHLNQAGQDRIANLVVAAVG